jgi:catechol 2,3-dioxygenase-like lactoylglutathione lyase family enzyme
LPIQNVVVNTADVQRSVDFYTRFLDAELVGRPTSGRAVLDLITATIELRQAGATRSMWRPDDLQKGFRHLGFKVDRVDPRAEVLRRAGTRFHLDPLDAEGGVRICFFFDPDGTLLELVEGDLQYASILDPEGVALERALGVPSRPRFDHIAVTVEDRATTDAFYRERFGFRFIGTIEQPHDDRGFSIGYLKSGDTVIEVFTYQTVKQDRRPQLDAPGFSHAHLGPGSIDGLSAFAGGNDTAVFLDPDGFPFTASAREAQWGQRGTS